MTIAVDLGRKATKPTNQPNIRIKTEARAYRVLLESVLSLVNRKLLNR